MTLANTLENEIIDRLKALETEGRETVREGLLNSLLNPASAEATQKWQDASARVDDIAAILKPEQTFPWIHKYLSACAFEAMYVTCVHNWLAAGPPTGGANVQPSVQDYVRWQVKTFVTAIGGDRPP